MSIVTTDQSATEHALRVDPPDLAGADASLNSVTTAETYLPSSSEVGLDPDLGAAPAVTGALEPGIEQLDATVVLPFYNEQRIAATSVEAITAAMDASGYSYELLAIDDKSGDGTLAVLHDALPLHPRMRVVALRRHSGPGAARRIGTELARGRIVAWTATGYPSESIPEFITHLVNNTNADQVVGARPAPRGILRLPRGAVDWVARRIAEALTSAKIPDSDSGLRAFRRAVALPYLGLLPPGASCTTTLTLSFLSNQHTIDYLPIARTERGSDSGYPADDHGYHYLLQVLRMVMYFNPIKVLMPIALWVFGIGVVKGIVDIIRYQFRLTTNSILLILSGLIIGAIALLADLIVRSRSDQS